jgi:hypothetical protein
MRPSRRTQPYRRGSRQAGAALSAMLAGRSAWGQNPADTRRAFERASKLRRALTRR